MSKPPEDVSSNELLQMLLQRPRPSEVVDFPAFDKPNKKGRIRIQVLTKDQHDKARMMARKRLKESAQTFGISLDIRDENSAAVQGVEGDLAACEVLAMAAHTENALPGQDDGAPLVRYGRIFTDGTEVGKVLTADEVAYLFAAYNIVQHKMGPHEAICSDEDVSMWVRRLVEGADTVPFLRLAAPQWAELLTKFATRLHELSGILESQWESLPDSLKSVLRTFCLGTTSSGEPAASTSSDPALPAGDMSMDQAMRLANLRLRRAPETDE